MIFRRMKYCLLVIAAMLYQQLSFSQKLNTGTYIFKYCDFEYNNCYSTCKVVIKGDNIAVYATKKLAQIRTFTKEGDIIARGIILKHKSGQWIIGRTRKDINAKQIGIEGPPVIDFKKRQFWTF